MQIIEAKETRDDKVVILSFMSADPVSCRLEGMFGVSLVHVRRLYA